ncbi:MAG: nucleotide sugar aminotransferase [Betaproteobacteria bacterium]|nr:nucleotide sugar aminotransferase [Betaproteobacteria bacterium]
MRLRELPPTAGLAPRMLDLVERPRITLEAQLCGWLGVPQVLVESSGSAALSIAFEYLKMRSPAREVVVPAFTCPLVPLAAAKAGLKVRACDTTQTRFDLDVAKLAPMLSERTLCVIPTHWGGALSDTAAVRAVVTASGCGAYILEDCAQAFGSTINGQPLGRHADIAIFSFAVGKGLTLYEGGVVSSTDPMMRAGLEAVSTRLAKAKRWIEALRILQLIGYHCGYRPATLRLLYGLPRLRRLKRNDIIKALGDDQPLTPLGRVGRWRMRVAANAIQRLPAHLATSRDTFQRLAKRLSRLAGVRVHASPRGASAPCTYIFLTFQSPEGADWVLAESAPMGLGITRLYAFTLDRYPHLASVITDGPFPCAANLAARTVTLTTSVYMTSGEETQVVDLISKGATIGAGGEKGARTEEAREAERCRG